MEALTLGLFCAALLLCLILDWSILYALGFGLVLFLLYGRHKGFAWKELAKIALRGVKTIRNILITFVLIGILTAFWRASGTIPVIVSTAGVLISPKVFLLMTFLLNCLVSMLTGTSFGTAATMGVICATIGASMKVDPVMMGGAVLSGIYFGDRCSPVSTSALLVAAVTKTDIYGNIRRMVKSALIPFLAAGLLYALLGFAVSGAGEAPDLKALFGQEFSLHWLAFVPAAVILALAACRVNVKISMGASILAAIPICIFLQGTAPAELLKMAFTGFEPEAEALKAMLTGGGILSMVRVAGIVSISSSYSGLFQETGLLDGVKTLVDRVAEKSTSYAAMLATSIATCVVACNQTLTILLTNQLCKDRYQDEKELALDLEDSAEIVSPLIPWCIAGSVPLAAVGASAGAMLFAFYLYLLPLWRLGKSLTGKRKRAGKEKQSVSLPEAGGAFENKENGE
ncbi:MAG: sodium:proton antiporter [Lachnospiraceae bacterium]|nr:sodium:proton antiporter [Lachnospiraceae bacterium]